MQAILRYGRPVLRVGMGNFFARNIDRRGRILRGVWGIALIIAGVLLWAERVGLLPPGSLRRIRPLRGRSRLVSHARLRHQDETLSPALA